MQQKPSSTLETMFRLANLAVLPGWFMMIVAPRSRWTQRIVSNDAFFIGMGGLYATMLGSALANNPDGANSLFNPTLQNISRLFQEGGPQGTFAGWVHYLVFDFFVGRSILRDAQEQHIPHALVVPALLLTLMSGPIGLAYYRLVVRLRGGR